MSDYDAIREPLYSTIDTLRGENVDLRSRLATAERDLAEAQERINRVSAEAIAANSAAESAERDRDEAREAAKRAMSACGNPDAAEGCRNVLAILGAALNGGGPE